MPPVEDFEAFKTKGEPERFPGKLYIKIIGARKLKKSWTDVPDPFVEAKLSGGDKNILTTKVINDNINPIWNYEGEF